MKYKLGVFLNSNPKHGGQFQYCLSVVEALKCFPPALYEIVAIIYYDVWMDILKESNFKKIKLERKLGSMHRQIVQMQFDLMIYPTTRSEINLSEIVPNIPFVAMIHDMNFYFDGVAFDCKPSDKDYIVRLRHRGNVCNRARGIFVDSIMSKNQIIQVYGEACKNKIYVQPFTLPNYIQMGHRENGKAVLKSLPEKYFFYPAQFHIHKNHRILLYALKFLEEQGKKIHLVFCGNPQDYFQNTVELINELDIKESVTILPYVSNDEMLCLYQSARAMIMPTLVGPTNIPPLEAMYMGCPVAVSNIGAMPEQIGDAGMIFDPYSIVDTANCMIRLWENDDLCRELIARGRIQVEKYSVKNFNRVFYQNIMNCLKDLDNETRNLRNLDDFVKGKKIICYGAGRYGYWISRYLQERGTQIEAFFDQYSTDKLYCGVPIVKIEKYSGEKQNTAVVLCLGEDDQRKVKKELEKWGFHELYFINPRNEIWEIMKFLNCYVNKDW